MNVNKHQKVFNLNHGIHYVSSLSPPKLIRSSVVMARSDTATATWHAYLHIFDKYNIKMFK